MYNPTQHHQALRPGDQHGVPILPHLWEQGQGAGHQAESLLSQWVCQQQNLLLPTPPLCRVSDSPHHVLHFIL